MSKVYIMDTNILCCLLGVKMKGTIGNGEISKVDIENKIRKISSQGDSIAIPFPVMLEIGNHIGHAKDRAAMLRLLGLINSTFVKEAPWHNFAAQELLWTMENLKKALPKWHEVLYQEIGLGDFFIIMLKNACENGMLGFRAPVEIWSADAGLLKSQHYIIFEEEKPRRKSRN